MHELAVTESIRDIAVRRAEEMGARRITQIDLVIGQLSSMIDDCVQFYWDIISRDTLAEGARLCFRRVPAQFACDDCGARYPLRQDDFTCPTCGGSHVKIVSGEEFYVESIDVETELTGVSS